ncbi:NACHT domain-containing protein [Micromonospora echinospora]|uniref:NACHT domain-containing protein n=1 Tax=Micromonospora echinospora TaxID=1877 RepID=UPI003670DC1A
MTAAADTFAVEVLRRDLTSFADPATEVKIKAEANRWFRAAWLQDGVERSARFLLPFDNSAFPELVQSGGVEFSYRSFLAGPHMADLRAVARNALNIMLEMQPYIVPLAKSLDDPDAADLAEEADALISRLAVPGVGQTLVVFLSAEAGVGKTSLLRHLARRSAAAYLAGSSERLWIYVDAQGRRLAQLDEALAAELDDVRARFPYHAVSSLVRTGALIIAVDGFDELVGSIGSYEEAFSSLAKFISDLNGYGCLVAAARSSYYEQEFLTRANSVLDQSPDAWTLSGVRLLDWDPAKREAFVRAFGELHDFRGAALDQYTQSVTTVLNASEVREVAGKPLFVKSTADLLIEGALPGGATLLDQLVSGYVRREVTQKLRSGSGRPLLTDDQYRLLLAEVAEEMWRQEVRQLSNTSVRELAKLVSELLDLRGEAVSEVVERLPSAALLRPGNLEGSVTFEHDIFYSYFLAEPVASTWLSDDAAALGRLLRRGRLPEEAAILTGGRIGGQEPQQLLKCLAAAIKFAYGDAEQVRRNAGSLASSIISGKSLSRLVVRDFVFGDADWAGTELLDATIEDCKFIGTDLSGAQFVRCTARSVTLDKPIVDPSGTRLGISGLDVEDFYGIGVRSGGRERWFYAPGEMRRVLEDCGLPAARTATPTRSVPGQIVQIVDRLCRNYSKGNALTEGDDSMAAIVNDPYWSRVKQALLESGVLSVEYKSAAGQKVFLKRHARPQDIMAGLDPRAEVPEIVRAFWQAIEDAE